MMPYLYRLLNRKEEVIYVGKTDDIADRMTKHFKGKSNLPPEVHYKELRFAEYFFSSVSLDIDMYEKHFIKKWKPKYNTSEIVGEPLTVEPSVRWVRYNKQIRYDLKTKLLIQLEDDLEDARLVVRDKEQVIAEKEQEIAELRRLLAVKNKGDSSV